MDFFFNEGIIKLRDQARKIAKEKIMPVAAKHDQTEEFPWEIMNMLAEHDLFGIFVEKKDGGLGLGILGLAVATEELSRACGGITLGLAGSALGVMPILLSASEEQKKKLRLIIMNAMTPYGDFEGKTMPDIIANVDDIF